jgi:hypothetical protein
MHAVNVQIHTGCFWTRRAAAQFNKRAAGDGRIRSLSVSMRTRFAASA